MTDTIEMQKLIPEGSPLAVSGLNFFVPPPYSEHTEWQIVGADSQVWTLLRFFVCVALLPVCFSGRPAVDAESGAPCELVGLVSALLTIPVAFSFRFHFLPSFLYDLVCLFFFVVSPVPLTTSLVAPCRLPKLLFLRAARSWLNRAV